MTDVGADHKFIGEVFLKEKEEFGWSDSNFSKPTVTKWSSHSEPQINSQNNPDIVSCKVCGDKSSGRHYGQLTCEGCKSFFKRSIRRKFDYACRNNKQCRVTMEQRNQCQACRFIKCLKVGMRKDAVQGLRSNRHQADSTMENTQNPINSPSDISVDEEEWNSFILPETNITIKDVLNSILQAENAAPIKSIDDFYNQSIHILYSIVDWSKKLIYIDKISVTDNLLLVQNCWCQLFLLNYSLCGLTGKLFYNANSNTQSFLTIQSQLLALSRLPMDAVEYGCLKAIIFFNPDTPLLFNSTLVDNAQEAIQIALESHIKNSSSNKTRFGRVLLRIPYLQRVTTKHILEVFFNNANESFLKSINELFHKLLSVSKLEERSNRT